ncbi:MAG: tetraacyldisaccharide 4'-kinase [Bacteroidia bacterium]|nr:tetraacyldisaccharide 4'-kinase [Bacteroidia bacterium]
MKELSKIPLLPLALLFGLVTFIRNRLYDLGFIKSHHPLKHTICVGNLSVGGSGKTPHVEYLINLLKSEYALATLSRGYKRKTSGYIIADDKSTAEDIGDEPLLYKTKHPNLTVCVEVNRVKGVKKLAEHEPSPHVIILDDAFQHRPIKCGLNIVVSEYENLYYNDFLMPVGRLRESKSGMHRADIIVISKTPEKTTPVEIRNVLKDIKPLPHQHVFFSYLKYGDLYSISNPNESINTLQDLFRYRLIVFTGIANPSPMITYLKEYSAGVSHLPFDDHHDYNIADIANIQKYYESFEGGNKLIVTTEKDLMRLKLPEIWAIAERMNIFVLPVEVTFKDKAEEFNEIILKYVRTNRIYHQKYT